MAEMKKALLAWRKKQPKGAIMKPETFKEIVAEAKAKGLPEKRAKKVAGKAYWKTAKKKFKKRGK